MEAGGSKQTHPVNSFWVPQIVDNGDPIITLQSIENIQTKITFRFSALRDGSNNPLANVGAAVNYLSKTLAGKV